MKKTYEAPKLSFEGKNEDFYVGVVAVVVAWVWHLVG